MGEGGMRTEVAGAAKEERDSHSGWSRGSTLQAVAFVIRDGWVVFAHTPTTSSLALPQQLGIDVEARRQA